MTRTNDSMLKVPTRPLQLPTSTYPKNFSRTARSFQDKDVRGMIFTCRHETWNECLEKKLFGLPYSHYSRVKNIKPGLPLFLLNLSNRKLYGIFEAASHGKMYIDRKAWTRNPSESTLRPAQVRIHIRLECRPLEEKMYTQVIEKYDQTNPLSWFELNLMQTEALLNLFLPLTSCHSLWLDKYSHDNWLPGPPDKKRLTVNRDSKRMKKVEADWSCDETGFIEPDTNLTADAKWTKVVSRKHNEKCKPSVGVGNASKYSSNASGSTHQEKEKMVTKENLSKEEILEIAYGDGGVDVSIPEIDIIIGIRYKRLRARGVVEKVEEKIDEKEKHRINNILEKIDKESHGIDGRFIVPDNLPDVKYFLVYPKEDIECTEREMSVRRLDIYYKRLFPNVESAHNLACEWWNKLPEADSQYLRLFSKLWGLFDQKSFITYLETTTPTNRREDFVKAKENAENLQLGKLGDCDISECLEDVFRERDIIALHNLKTECDMYLLECMHCQEPKEFAPKTPIPVCRNVTYFCPRSQKKRFDMLMMDKVKGLELDAGLGVIKEHHKKSLEEDCSIRFRYVKFKRALAKDLGIISEETFQQELGDYLNEASVGVF